VIVHWGELGLGKTTLMIKQILWLVLRFDYHVKMPNTTGCGFPDESGCLHDHLCVHWQEALEKVDFTFWEVRKRIKYAVMNNRRLLVMGWDDLGVYFHKSNIMYMHPEVKDFFSKYNFVRPYMANLIITVPDISFVPGQLLTFCTGDVWIDRRGHGDFDRGKLMRNFWGSKPSWTKHYDGVDVVWTKAPDDVYKVYEGMRHEHAVEAFKKPEEIFVTAMPKAKEFAEEDSLF